ncbi:MAG: hypothetical protein QOC56_2636, partial [Alphaproteobacteria bacterium]|nr:hypothetical protein [Alphaproteobacteria bacterium]
MTISRLSALPAMPAGVIVLLGTMLLGTMLLGTMLLGT